jgi:hypothetical protein
MVFLDPATHGFYKNIDVDEGREKCLPMPTPL